MRCICLSHETALEFWRLWSARNGIALHLFHCRKTMQTDDLPFRIFPSSAVLVDSSSAKRTVVEIIDGALEDGVPEELAELLGRLSRCLVGDAFVEALERVWNR